MRPWRTNSNFSYHWRSLVIGQKNDMERCACTLLHWQWDDQRRLGHCRLFFDLKVLESTSQQQQQQKIVLVNCVILYDLSWLENLITYVKLKKNNLYLSSAVFLAQMLAGPSKRLEQIIQTKHNVVKDLNWPEANRLAIYKPGWGFQLEATVTQIQVVVRTNFEPGTYGLWVRRSDHSATLPLPLQV